MGSKCQIIFKLTISIILILFLTSCKDSYEKINGHWYWSGWNEGVGNFILDIDSIDNESFKVLEQNDNYSKDKKHVYLRNNIITGADPKSFELINDDGYSKDKNNVYLYCEKIIFADPNTFIYLDFPYSKDKHRVFCGVLPIDLSEAEVKEFKVKKENESMHTTTELFYFISENPNYQWLDTLGINGVTIGIDGKGETKYKLIDGIKVINK